MGHYFLDTQYMVFRSRKFSKPCEKAGPVNLATERGYKIYCKRSSSDLLCTMWKKTILIAIYIYTNFISSQLGYVKIKDNVTDVYKYSHYTARDGPLRD